MAIDKVAKANAEMEIEHAKYLLLQDNSSFKLNEKSLRMYTKFIKYYTGESFKFDKQIECYVYPKETLIHICNDGNSVEYHLK